MYISKMPLVQSLVFTLEDCTERPMWTMDLRDQVLCTCNFAHTFSLEHGRMRKAGFDKLARLSGYWA